MQYDQIYGMMASKVFPGLSFMRYMCAVYTDKIHRCPPKVFYIMMLLEDFDGVVDMDFLISQCWPNFDKPFDSARKQFYDVGHFLLKIGRSETVSVYENTALVVRPAQDLQDIPPMRMKPVFKRSEYLRIVSAGQDVFVNFKNLAITKIHRDEKALCYELVNGTQGHINDIENIDEVANHLAEQQGKIPVEPLYI